MVITPEEKRHYPLTGKDSEILERIHEIESIGDLSIDEKFLLSLLRSQLEKDWQTPCLQLLKKWSISKRLTPLMRWEILKKLGKRWWRPRQRK